jgi:hypothetical protein
MAPRTTIDDAHPQTQLLFGFWIGGINRCEKIGIGTGERTRLSLPLFSTLFTGPSMKATERKEKRSLCSTEKAT